MKVDRSEHAPLHNIEDLVKSPRIVYRGYRDALIGEPSIELRLERVQTGDGCVAEE